jgi:hypothetical protein
MTTNVRLRSNVHVRSTADIRQDFAFQGQVRGHGALRKMVSKLIPYPSREYLKERLTDWQLSQYEEPECPFCNCQVYGPVRHGSEVIYSWRRPPQYCECWKHIG